MNIEVQLKNLGNMDKRTLFYWSRDYTRNIEAGDDYEKLPAVIAINIVNFEYLGTKDFHASFHLREDREPDYILTEALEIHFIDMVKFRRLREKDIKNNTLHRWMAYFDRESPPEVVKEVLNMDAAIQKAESRMAFVTSDKEALRAYQMREMALSDWTSGINHARWEGRSEGKAEGGKQKAAEIARNLKAMGLAAEQIVIATGLTQEDIENL